VVGGEKDGGRRSNFSVREARHCVVALSVRLCVEAQPLWLGGSLRCSAVRVSYEVLEAAEGPAISMGLKARENLRIGKIQPIRLVGECVKWNTRSPGLEFAPQPFEPSDDWREHRLCCRMQGDTIDFQVVSSSLGFRWRCYPKTVQRGVHVLPRGATNDVEVEVGGESDGHGRNFRVQEPAFTIVTLSAWLRMAEEPAASPRDRCVQVMVAYAVGDTGLTVGIGPSHVQYPLKRRR